MCISLPIEAVIDFKKGFWKKERKLSGKEIDKLRGQNIPHNSKAIDKTIGLNCIVSHKSTDVRCKSYLSVKKLYHLGMFFVRQLAEYQGEVRQDHNLKATYNLHWAIEDPGCSRILEWFIPHIDIPSNQKEALKQVIDDASKLGIRVHVYQILDY